MNEKHLKLFTKVEDGLPEDGIHVTVILKNEFQTIGARKNGTKWQVFDPYSLLNDLDDESISVIGWLDLSTLTTKAAALELAEDAYNVGINNGFDEHGNSFFEGSDFINQNKDRL